MRKWKILIIALILGSCESGDASDINCEYQGGIIYEKHPRTKWFGCYYTIKYEGEFIEVSAFDLDSHYEVGDTINGTCLGETND
jgi:hypothetical protein